MNAHAAVVGVILYQTEMWQKAPSRCSAADVPFGSSRTRHDDDDDDDNDNLELSHIIYLRKYLVPICL